jgi:catechol 2,3-dioxygenase-like lactoylglutathione lyase family enzyme
MINGAHVIAYSRDAQADRAFLSDVLGFAGVDAGDGWLILKLPPAEIAVHPPTGRRGMSSTSCATTSRKPLGSSVLRESRYLARSVTRVGGWRLQ